MGFKMSVPYLGLTRKAGEKGKHKANVRAICLEAGRERVSLSETFDETRSHLNTFEGFESGGQLADWLEDSAESFRQKVKGKDKAGHEVIREKGLRKDAIIGFAVIFKPPSEVIEQWDRPTRERFFADCHAVAAELEPELFAERNIKTRARHRDEEGEHEHDIGIPLTEDGRYNGSDMLNHMRRNFNENFARLMRERDWEMDDLDLYDAKRAATDEAYKQERIERKRHQGQSVNKHAAEDNERRAKEALEQAEALLAEAKTVEAELDERERLVATREAEAETIIATAKQKAEAEANKIKTVAETEASQIKSTARTEANRIKADADSDAQTVRAQANADANVIRAEAASALKSREEAVEQRESSVAEKEAEQTKKQKEFQAWEDQFEAQKEAMLDAKEELSPVKSVLEFFAHHLEEGGHKAFAEGVRKAMAIYTYAFRNGAMDDAFKQWLGKRKQAVRSRLDRAFFVDYKTIENDREFGA